MASEGYKVQPLPRVPRHDTVQVCLLVVPCLASFFHISLVDHRTYKCKSLLVNDIISTF